MPLFSAVIAYIEIQRAVVGFEYGRVFDLLGEDLAAVPAEVAAAGFHIRSKGLDALRDDHKKQLGNAPAVLAFLSQDAELLDLIPAQEFDFPAESEAMDPFGIQLSALRKTPDRPDHDHDQDRGQNRVEWVFCTEFFPGQASCTDDKDYQCRYDFAPIQRDFVSFHRILPIVLRFR